MSKCRLLLEENESLGREIVCGNSQNLLRDLNAQGHIIHSLTYEIDRLSEIDGDLRAENDELREMISSLLPSLSDESKVRVVERMATLSTSSHLNSYHERKRKRELV
jgi:hypothetical protein